MGRGKYCDIGKRHDVMHLDVEKLKWLSHTERTPDMKKLAFLVVLDLLLCRALHLLQLLLLLWIEARNIRRVHEGVLDEEVLQLLLSLVVVRSV